MDWDDLRYFLALARKGSVRAAGASLGVSHSTVARRVENLEDGLGSRLFDRSAAGWTLTAAGLQLRPGAEHVEAEMAAMERSLSGMDELLAGTIALTCCDHFISDLLLDLLAGFCQSHPDIELCVITDSRPFDLARRECDLAVRILPREAGPPESLIGTRIGPVTVANFVAVAHQAQLDPHLPGSQPRWVAGADPEIQRALIQGSSYPHIPSWGSFSSLELMSQAALQGLGLLMAPTYVADANPRFRRLQHPDLRHLADLWLLCHPDLRANARFRAARAWIARSFQQLHPLLSGASGPFSHPPVANSLRVPAIGKP